MGEANKTKTLNSSGSSYTEFYYHFFHNILLVGIPLIIVLGLVLSSFRISATVGGGSADSLTLSLPTSCTLSSVVNSTHNATLISGTYTSDIGKTTITTLCNDGNGYAIYANGLSNGIVGNNTLISSVSNNHNIATGIYEQGDTTSSWAMKLGNVSGDTSPTPPIIEQGYNNTYGLVPNTWTKVTGRQSGTTDMITGSSFTTTYAVYTAPTQHAGTYTGQVAYVLIHGSGDSPAPDVHCMQDIANWKNELLNPGDTTLAMDTRDGKWYWVTKLADGHIWMTQNLDLDLDPAKPLTSNDTDLTDHSLTGAYVNGYNYDANTGITTWTPAITAKTVTFEGDTISNWQGGNTTPASADKTDGTNTGHAAIGNYYSWAAAIASNDSSTLTGNTSSNITNNPQNSICPKGWRLPTISNQSGSITNSTSEFARLNYLYNNNSVTSSSNLLIEPLWFIKAGYIQGSSLSLFESAGLYWSSTTHSSTQSPNLDFRNNSVNPASTTLDYKHRGFSVRCVAR